MIGQHVGLILLMFFGAYGAAYLPFALEVHESQIFLLSSFGGGLMLGCVLSVIIPEGFHSWFESEHLAVEGHHAHGDRLPFALTGICLTLGYLLMVAMDQMQQSKGACCSGHGAKSLSQEDSHGMDGAKPNPNPEKAIIGLMIHCIADGVAMGSAFLSGNARMSFLLATAMVLHKAPMAFGLASYLISCNWTWQRSQQTILWFSAMAPLSTIVTFVVFSHIPLFGGDQGVALAILFSGGTFLHAAAHHILPDVLRKRLSSSALVSLSIGSFLPAIFSIGHHH